MQNDPIQIQRSRRRTLSAQIGKDGTVLVKAPLTASQAQIDAFLESHKRWIQTHREKAVRADQKALQEGRLSDDEIRSLAQKALEYIPPRAAYYAQRMGVTYGRITIRNQRSRWGSCSSRGNLNFNCLLMLTPPEVIDSVIVHELAHRKEMNHSERFYAEILKVFPDYRKYDRWLKENGPVLIRRMTG